jgi:hypothetical protein
VDQTNRGETLPGGELREPARAGCRGPVESHGAKGFLGTKSLKPVSIIKRLTRGIEQTQNRQLIVVFSAVSLSPDRLRALSTNWRAVVLLAARVCRSGMPEVDMLGNRAAKCGRGHVTLKTFQRAGPHRKESVQAPVIWSPCEIRSGSVPGPLALSRFLIIDVKHGGILARERILRSLRAGDGVPDGEPFALAGREMPLAELCQGGTITASILFYVQRAQPIQSP